MNAKRIIQFEFYNSYTKNSLGSIQIPFDRIKSSNGHYSRAWRVWKDGLAKLNNLDRHWVRAKISIL